MDPAGFRLHYGIEPPDVSAGARLAAAKFIVRDLTGLRALLGKAGIPAGEHMGTLVVGPDAAMGAALAFATS
jgi:hypothetical protein